MREVGRSNRLAPTNDYTQCNVCHPERSEGSFRKGKISPVGRDDRTLLITSPMFHDLAQWMLDWAESPYAVWALFFLAVAESSFFPIPPDVLLIALVLSNPDQGVWLAVVTTAGSVIGGVIGYFIGLWGGRPILQRFVPEKAIEKVQQQFDRYGGWAVGVAAFTPIPYKVFTIASGAFAFKLPVFIVASLVGRGGRFFVVAASIQLFGTQMVQFVDRYFNIGSLVLIVVIVGSFVLVHLLRRKPKSA